MSGSKILLKQIIQAQQPDSKDPPGSSNSIRKFTKTKIQQQEITNSNNHQHITQPAIYFETDAAVEYAVEQILKNMEHMIQVNGCSGKFAIKSTLSVLIDDPNLGILDSNQILKQHRKSVIVNDLQPRPSAFIDGSVGHVKVQQLIRKPKQQTDSDSKKHNNQKRLSKNGKISKARYSNLSRKSLLSYASNLPPIFERKGTHQEENKIMQQVKGFISKNKVKNNVRSNSTNQKFSSNRFSQSSQSQPQTKFVNLGLNKQQQDDQFINYLRYVKVDYPNQNCKLGEVHVSRRNSQTSLTGLNLNIQNVTNKSFESKDNNISNNTNTIMPITQIKNQANSLKKKKAITYQSLVSVNQGKSQMNAYSYDGQNPFRKQMECLTGKLLNKQTNEKSKKYIKSKNLDSLNSQRQQKLQSKRSMKKSDQSPTTKNLNSPRVLNKQYQSNDKQIKLPVLNLRRNSRASQNLIAMKYLKQNNIQTEISKTEQISVWLRQKQKIKQYDNKLNAFMSLNSIKQSVQIRSVNCNEDSRIKQLKQVKNKSGHNKMDSQDMQQKIQRKNELQKIEQNNLVNRLQKQHILKKQKQNNEMSDRSKIHVSSRMIKKSKLQVGEKYIQNVNKTANKQMKTNKKMGIKNEQQSRTGIQNNV